MLSFDKKPTGYNPIRWDCERQGCFNVKCRPKIEVFADCFPGKINFGDVDGIVEINSKALLLEWKTEKNISRGQQIMYERITSSGLISVLCIIGNAETMESEEYCIFFNGRQSKWRIGKLGEIKTRIRKWVTWAQKLDKED